MIKSNFTRFIMTTGLIISLLGTTSCENNQSGHDSLSPVSDSSSPNSTPSDTSLPKLPDLNALTQADFDKAQIQINDLKDKLSTATSKMQEFKTKNAEYFAILKGQTDLILPILDSFVNTVVISTNIIPVEMAKSLKAMLVQTQSQIATSKSSILANIPADVSGEVTPVISGVFDGIREKIGIIIGALEQRKISYANHEILKMLDALEKGNIEDFNTAASALTKTNLADSTIITNPDFQKSVQAGLYYLNEWQQSPGDTAEDIKLSPQLELAKNIFSSLIHNDDDTNKLIVQSSGLVDVLNNYYYEILNSILAKKDKTVDNSIDSIKNLDLDNKINNFISSLDRTYKEKPELFSFNLFSDLANSIVSVNDMFAKFPPNSKPQSIDTLIQKIATYNMRSNLISAINGYSDELLSLSIITKKSIQDVFGPVDDTNLDIMNPEVKAAADKILALRDKVLTAELIDNEDEKLGKEIYSTFSDEYARFISQIITIPKSKIDSMTVTIETLHGTVTELKEAKKSLEEQIDSLDSQLVTKREMIDSLSVQLNIVTTQLIDTKAELDQRTIDLESAKKTIEEQDAKYKNAITNLADLNGKLTAETSVNAVQAAKITELQLSLTDITDLLDAEKSKSANLQSLLDTVNLTIAAKSVVIETQNAQITDLKSKITDLLAQITGMSGDYNSIISGLKQQISDLNQQVTTLTQDKAGLDASLKIAQDKNTELTTDLATASTNISNLTDQIKLLKTQLQTEKDKNTTLTESNAGLTASNVDLQNKLNTANTSITGLQNQLYTSSATLSNVFIILKRIAGATNCLTSIEACAALVESNNTNLVSQIDTLTQAGITKQTINGLNSTITNLNTTITALNLKIKKCTDADAISFTNFTLDGTQYKKTTYAYSDPTYAFERTINKLQSGTVVSKKLQSGTGETYHTGTFGISFVDTFKTVNLALSNGKGYCPTYLLN